MRQEYTEKDYRNILGSNLTESDVINKKMQDAYKTIRNRTKTSAHKKKDIKGFILGMSAVAAALVLSVTVCVANPALAAKLPFIGHIFDTVERDISYSGDYSTSSEQLIKPEEIKEDGTIDSPYVQKSNGITFTMSECNYESMAMYLAVSVEAEEGFSEEFRQATAMSENDYNFLAFESTAVADFSNAGYGKVSFDAAHGLETPYIIEGKFIDDHTFAGIIRVNLMNMTALDEAGEYQKLTKIPDEFSYELNISDIYADYEGEHFKGSWSFALDVKLNHENTITKEINEVNEGGIGIASVTKTEYELCATLILPEDLNSGDYIVAICDANGKPLESQGMDSEIYSVYQRDVSKIYIYVVEYMTYMNECKGNAYEKLPEKAEFKTEVNFGE